MFHTWAAVLAAVFVLLPLGRVGAAPLVDDPERWDDPPSLDGWINAAPIGQALASLDNPGSGGWDGDGFLRVTFNGVGPQRDTVYSQGQAPSDNFRAVSGAEFGFWSDMAFVGLAALVFHPAGEPAENVWAYGFDHAAPNVWQGHYVPFDYEAGWVGYGDGADFLSDLDHVDWIGVDLLHPGGGPHVFGLDNWTYQVPEPSLPTVLAMAFIAMAPSLLRMARGMRMEKMGKMKRVV